VFRKSVLQVQAKLTSDRNTPPVSSLPHQKSSPEKFTGSKEKINKTIRKKKIRNTISNLSRSLTEDK
jgi:hypothetical protein